MQTDAWNGKNLKEMFRTGTSLLSANSSTVNALNVFPVPDGDTGTNMLLTMQSAMVEADQFPNDNASAVAHAMAHGALMGARGNSGVILSQILRGLAQGLDDRTTFSAKDFANSLLQASIMADRSVSQPVEGTILTVMRDASSAGKSASMIEQSDLHSVIEAVVDEARESVVRTPSLLPVLRESGVVDAGGQGLCIILEGLLYYLQGKEITEEETVTNELQVAVTKLGSKPQEYGYCTEFLIKGNALNLDEMRARLNEMGEHVLVVGDEKTARIHIHTLNPGAVLTFGTSVGKLHKIKIDNMEEQHQEFITNKVESYIPPQGKIAVIAVASGEGLIEVFRSLGATQIVNGGNTMNPSVQDLLKAVDSVPANEVIIIPNNPDILPTAQQVCEIASKRVVVVPSRTIMQGIAALVSFNLELDLNTNASNMTATMSEVRTGQIATAVRSMQYNGLQVHEGQIIAFADEELAVAEPSFEDALAKLLEKIPVEESEILTVYYGCDVNQADAEKLFDPVRSWYQNLEVELLYGGQPHYQYLISIE